MPSYRTPVTSLSTAPPECSDASTSSASPSTQDPASEVARRFGVATARPVPSRTASYRQRPFGRSPCHCSGCGMTSPPPRTRATAPRKSSPSIARLSTDGSNFRSAGMRTASKLRDGLLPSTSVPAESARSAAFAAACSAARRAFALDSCMPRGCGSPSKERERPSAVAETTALAWKTFSSGSARTTSNRTASEPWMPCAWNQFRSCPL
mmetsp:Transcript_85472/g.275670  ORF Transcript_85472/g.275670 Transcript_85472/m.275670 type:complete len:209 (+) Transcript_85472:1355-1981(+)